MGQGLYKQAKFLTAGDMAISVEIGESITPEIHRKVLAMLIAIQKESLAGIIDLVPTYRSILVKYNPLESSLSDIEKRLRLLEKRLEVNPVESAGSVIELPVVYGGKYGPDLNYVAEYNRLSPVQVIQIHSNITYPVYMMGFSPGFPYLGGIPERISTPRLDTPRLAIAAGSVGIADNQTGIYPTESPGGWRIIGRTPIQLFNPMANPPTVVEIGDSIRFIPIPEENFKEIEKQIQDGSYGLERLFHE